MTTYQMQAFLTLAATLNYTRASKILHTTQPNLSKIIVNLEQETGVQLLVRNKRDVKLTPAGETFYKEIEQVMKQYQSALKKTQQVYDGITGILDVGFLGTALIRQLPQLVNRFHSAHPKILLNLYDYTYSPLVQALVNDTIDIAMLPDRELDTISGLEKKFIYADDMCLVVNKSHRLAGAHSVQLAELVNEPFVMMDAAVSDRDVEMVTSICADEDFAPKVVYEANTLNNLMLMIECNVGISILAKHMQHFATENICFVPISGYESYFRMVCAWRRKANPSVYHLLEVLDELI